MPASNIRYILGERYHLLKEGVTKAEAMRSAKYQRSGGMKARIEKVSRGNYRVWVGGRG